MLFARSVLTHNAAACVYIFYMTGEDSFVIIFSHVSWQYLSSHIEHKDITAP